MEINEPDCKMIGKSYHGCKRELFLTMCHIISL